MALVVDDNQGAADTLAKLPRLKGFDVAIAYTGLAALEQAAGTTFDAIVLDIGLPGISGHEVAERLRARGIRTRLVALTGWGTAGDVAKSLAAGFDIHLTKPITMPRLLEALGPTPPV